MPPFRGILPLLLGLCVIAGCSQPGADRGQGADPESRATRPEELAKCLPAGVTLSESLMGGDPQGQTVGGKLAELGAYAKGGKLFDSSGREIIFYHRWVPGVQPKPDLELQEQERERNELEKLKAKYTVIEITRFGV
jgi:hypothetical protein